MSLTTSMNNALSGLAAASRGAQVVSSNVANATTEGYGLRVLELSARANTGAGQGVKIDGVARVVDQTLISERWLANASSQEGERRLAAADAIVSILGEPDQPGSLSQHIASFEAALSLAVSRPDSAIRLTELLRAAEGVTSTFGRMTDETQTMREAADAEIGRLVEHLNVTLENVHELNGLILRARALGSDVPALLDERQKQIDSISGILPIRQVERDNGSIALYTPTGLALLDLTPKSFEFTPTATITAEMTLASGGLSGLRLDGRDLITPGDDRAIAGGALAAEFAIRDQDIPTFQLGLDALAADLISRFSDPAMDATILPGDPGLFTDAGGAFDPTLIDGLAGRLSLNPAVDPAAGGETWRLRDGIGAVAEGPSGDATLLSALQDRLGARRPAAVAIDGLGDAGFPAMVDAILSRVSADLGSREQQAAFHAVRFQTLDDDLRATGVNTDTEMQKLLLIERYYAANAKVIEAVDEMLGLLTRI